MKQSEWISVEDRLPEIDMKVIAHWDDKIITVFDYIDADSFEVFKNTKRDIAKVTHWQPIEPPEVKG